MDRITRIRIKNARAIEHVDLDVTSGFTVLIGENGTGKSTIIECLELLHKAAEPDFFRLIYQVHRGLLGLIRKGAEALELGLVIEDSDGGAPRLEYTFSLARRGVGVAVHSERLLVGPLGKETHPLVALSRRAQGGKIFDQKLGKLVAVPTEAIHPEMLVVASFGSLPPHRAIQRLLVVLRGISVHLGFDTLAGWAAQAVGRPMTVRGNSMLRPATRLDLLGRNLASSWNSLKNKDSKHWDHTMELVRLGLGDHIDSVALAADPGGGHVTLQIRRSGLEEPIDAADLSDGQLAWLAFIAMTRLKEGRTFLAIDEPERHLHPSLLGRVVSLLHGGEDPTPVLISTHADRVLELIERPAESVRVCRFVDGVAVVDGLDEARLEVWLETYGDLAALREGGFLPRVLDSAPSDDGPEVVFAGLEEVE